MNRLETFDYLMGIVDKWLEEKPERYGGACKDLRKDMWVREVIVTPGFHISKSMLKNFLAVEVLDIYTKPELFTS